LRLPGHLLAPAIVALALATASAPGCTDDPGAAADAAAGVDAGRPDLSVGCCRAEKNEDCAACFRNVAKCCYQDPGLGGMAALMAKNCRSLPACRDCCNECARLSCAQLKAFNDCPNLLQKKQQKR
jgi:hypothetical protein